MRKRRNRKRRKVSRKISYKEEESEEEIEMKGKIDGDIESFRLDCWKLLKFKIKEYLLDDKKSSIVQKEINKIEKDIDKMKYLIERFPLNENSKAGELLGGVCFDNPIKVALDLTVSFKLNRVFSKHFEKEGLSKRALVKEFLMKIYGEASSLEKRDMEDENVKSIGKYLSDDDFKFFSLCGFTLPNELIERILNYLPRNLDILSEVGGSCQFLYIKLLTTWKDIKVHGTNVFLTSTLALQNVEHLSIQKVTQAEQKYVWEHVNSSKLRRISIFGNEVYFRSVMNGIIKFKKNLKQNKDDPFRNISEINLTIKTPPVRYDRYDRKKTKSLNVSFDDIFPSLEIVNGLDIKYLFNFVENCSGIKKYHFRETIDYNSLFLDENDSVFYCIKEHINEKKGVKKIKVSFTGYEKYGGFQAKEKVLLSSLGEFIDLEELSLEFPEVEGLSKYWFDVTTQSSKERKLMFCDILILPIRSLEILNKSKERKYFNHQRSNKYTRLNDRVFETILINEKREINKNLRTLRIFASEIREKNS